MTDQTAVRDADLDDEADAAAEGESEDEGRRPSGRLPGKRLVLYVALPIVLLLAAAGGVYVSGLADSLLGIEHAEDAQAELLAEADAGPVVYYDLPDMLVNLNTNGRKTGYLKLSVSLELASEDDIELVEQVLPRVIDNFQVYLRELRVEDLRGSAGLQRLREELLIRVGTAARPATVRDVLFREMLVQ